jgi:hypothetical protein
MNDLVSEFFHEAVARIPAGLAVIVLFCGEQAANIFDVHPRFFASPSLFVVCVLAVAFVFGFVVDVITYYPIVVPLRALAPRCKWVARSLHLLGEVTPQKMLTLKEQVVELESKIATLMMENAKLKKEAENSQSQQAGKPWDDENRAFARELRRQFYFRGALIIMCRCLLVIFFVAGSLHLACCQYPDSILNLNGYHYFGCFFVFVIAWICLKKNQQRSIERLRLFVKTTMPGSVCVYDL